MSLITKTTYFYTFFTSSSALTHQVSSTVLDGVITHPSHISHTSGFIQSTSWSLTAVPANVVMAMTCLGVLSTVAHMRTFSQDRVLLARETSSGISIGAFFISQNVIDMAWVLIAPAMFLGGYYYLTLPVSMPASVLRST
jgi:hypothetical protein